MAPKLNDAHTILAPDGLLADKLKNFESRPEQQKMMQDVIRAYKEKKVALIEAGTGTGKSFAYIIPAVLQAAEREEKTIISTNTIQLQEQLIDKDIPLILKALGIKLKVVLVKGINNYVCMRKLEEVVPEKPALQPEEKEELEAIEQWANQTADGTLSTLPFVPSSGIWEKVGAERDMCMGKKCPLYKECHYMNARQEANDASILVVNHHLLLADLAVRAETDNYDENAVLPPYKRIIIDEAHHIEDIATDYFGSRLTRIGLIRRIKGLSSEKNGLPIGKFQLLKEKIQSQLKPGDEQTYSPILDRLTFDLNALKEELYAETQHVFDALADIADLYSCDIDAVNEKKLRLLPQHKTGEKWMQTLVPHAKRLIDTAMRLAVSAHNLTKDIENIDNEKLTKSTAGIMTDIHAYIKRITKSSNILNTFISDSDTADKVQWIESRMMKVMTNSQIVDAHLDISKAMIDHLFSKFPTVIMCSATLTTNRKFDYFRSRMGLTPEQSPEVNVIESIYDSPFNYPQQAMMIIPTDIPQTENSDYIKVVTENIWQAVKASQGSAFVLFTSYSMMKKCYQELFDRLQEGRFNTFLQGEETRKELLKKYINSSRAVLFGTDSFWEGVDVSGESLRCVIIVKLPFKVPSEPIIQARTEAIITKGGNPFLDYTVPNAIVKFKQGFGRLIRHKFDRGCIVCLDSRIHTKAYGKLFIASLPDCKKVFIESDRLYNQMKDFYIKTHYLTKRR